MATYWLKIANFPNAHLAPLLGVTPFEFM